MQEDYFITMAALAMLVQRSVYCVHKLEQIFLKYKAEGGSLPSWHRRISPSVGVK